jgi:ABC-type siderophore export system fused ATPase/permease subunit
MLPFMLRTQSVKQLIASVLLHVQPMLRFARTFLQHLSVELLILLLMAFLKVCVTSQNALMTQIALKTNLVALIVFALTYPVPQLTINTPTQLAMIQKQSVGPIMETPLHRLELADHVLLS